MAKPLQANIVAKPLFSKRMLLKAFNSTLLLFLFICLFSNNLFAQTTIESIDDGTWNSSSTWAEGLIPSSPDYAIVNHTDTIKSGTTVEVDSLTISATGKLVVEGTLIINGGLNMADNGSELITDSLASVFIFGNASLANKVTINLASYFVVLGDFTKGGASNQGQLTINNAHIYIFGIVDIPENPDTWQDFSVCEPGNYYGTTVTENDDCDAGQLDDFINNVEPGDLPDGIYEEIVGCAEPSIGNIPSTSDAQYCLGEPANSLSISATGDGLSYQWYMDDDTTPEEGDETAVDSNSQTYTPSTSTPGTFYFYCVVTGDCGTATSNVSGQITVNDLPNNTSSGFSGSTICSGEAGVLTFNALDLTFITPYIIEYTDGSTTWQQTINSDADFEFNVAVNPASTTTYTLTSISNGNCTRTSGFGDATAQIVVRELPNNTTTGFSGTTICEGETGILTFNALNTTFVETYTIEYTDGSTTWQQEITSDADYEFNVAVDPTTTTTYSLVSITNGNGCARTSGFGDETAQITVQPLPTATISGDATICEGESATIPVDLTGTPDWTLTFQLDGTNYLTVENIPSSPYNFNVTESGTYTVSSVSDANCTGTASGSATITVESTPVAGTLTKTPDETSVCEGNEISATLTPGSGGNGTEELEYSTNGGINWSSYTSGNAISTTGLTEVQIRTRRLADYCDDSGYNTVNWTVTQSGTPSVSIAANPGLDICNGTEVTFTATPTNGGTNPVYQWQVNGLDVGTNSNTYSYTPENDDIVACILTSDAVCATGSASIPVTTFSWNDDTKDVTDSDFGLNAFSIGGGEYITGGVGGTLALGPVTDPKTDIDLNFGDQPEFNTDGVDYSISYQRAENVGQLFHRGNSLIISGGNTFNVTYRLDDGAGSFITVTSSNFTINQDGSFHDYRFVYNPSDGVGRLYIDNSEVWTSSPTPGQTMYWTGAGNLIVGAGIDATGNAIPTFDNLSIKGIRLNTAVDEKTVTVHPLPATGEIIPD